MKCNATSQAVTGHLPQTSMCPPSLLESERASFLDHVSSHGILRRAPICMTQNVPVQHTVNWSGVFLAGHSSQVWQGHQAHRLLPSSLPPSSYCPITPCACKFSTSWVDTALVSYKKFPKQAKDRSCALHWSRGPCFYLGVRCLSGGSWGTMPLGCRKDNKVVETV